MRLPLVHDQLVNFAAPNAPDLFKNISGSRYLHRTIIKIRWKTWNNFKNGRLKSCWKKSSNKKSLLTSPILNAFYLGSFDFSKYDLVFLHSAWMSKGIKTQNQLFIFLMFIIRHVIFMVMKPPSNGKNIF
jgi:hypothetical protein